MAKFILHKIQTRNGFRYTVKDESGIIISTRESKRDYIACTPKGEFYFGRLDLIGKGDHGKALRRSHSDVVEELSQIAYLED